MLRPRSRPTREVAEEGGGAAALTLPLPTYTQLAYEEERKFCLVRGYSKNAPYKQKKI